MPLEHHARLPKVFVQDREERDLPCGRHVYQGNQAVIFAPFDLLVEMRNDADYQARGTDAGPRNVARSAARAFVILDAAIKAAQQQS